MGHTLWRELRKGLYLVGATIGSAAPLLANAPVLPRIVFRIGCAFVAPFAGCGATAALCVTTGPFRVCGVRMAPALENPPGTATRCGIAITRAGWAGCTRPSDMICPPVPPA